MQATLIRLLGAGRPSAPSAEAGMMAGKVTAAEEAANNWRKDLRFILWEGLGLGWRFTLLSTLDLSKNSLPRLVFISQLFVKSRTKRMTLFQASG